MQLSQTKEESGQEEPLPAGETLHSVLGAELRERRGRAQGGVSAWTRHPRGGSSAAQDVGSRQEP